MFWGTILGILVLISSSGCSLIKEYIPVSRRMPIIPMPMRPQLEPITKAELAEAPATLVKKLGDRDEALKKYAKKLEIGIKVYNEEARRVNGISGFYESLDERINRAIREEEKEAEAPIQ